MIKLLAMDVDGTLTDGGIYLFGNGEEFKRYDVHDGYGLVLLRRAGIRLAIISGRYSPATDARAKALGIDIVVNGTQEKLPELKRIAAELGLSAGEIAFIGDDEPDRECMEWCGLGIAVADARGGIADIADWITPSRGGFGALRDAAEYILARCEKGPV